MIFVTAVAKEVPGHRRVTTDRVDVEYLVGLRVQQAASSPDDEEAAL